MARPVPNFSDAPVKPTLTQLFINNQFVNAEAGETFDVTDPRTGDVVAKFQHAKKADVDKAVAAARNAFDHGEWPRMSGLKRGRVMLKIADLIEERLDRLAALESLDNGKPIQFSKAADIPLSAEHFRYFAGWADKIHGETLPHDDRFGTHFAYTLKEPIGVCGMVIPWNFPLLMAAWKLAPALATGCTVVLKPSEKTPMTALELAQICLDAGLPAGVVNVVPGFGPTTGDALVTHPGTDKIAFTGSAATAKYIHSVAGIKPVTMELGGKSPAIVYPDCDLDDAVAKIDFGIFFNHGQCCCASSRVYVHESIYDQFLEKAVAAANKRKVGDSFETVDQGPQVDQIQFDRIMAYIDHGKGQGRVMCGGKRLGDKGFYIEPTIFADMKDDDKVMREEVFGPVMAVAKWSTEEEVIRRANDTSFGLAAGLFTKDVANVARVSRALRAGTVWVNCWNVFDNSTPFGGYKESGIGREKGKAALDNFLQTKTVTMPIKGDPTWL